MHASHFPHRVGDAFPARRPCPGPLDRMWILSPVPAPRCRSGCSVPHLLHRSRGGSFRTEPLAFSCRQSDRVCAGSRSTFSRGRATASIEPPSERPALAVLLLRVLPFSSGRSRLNDWRRSDRRLQPNSGFQRWRTACGRGPVIPVRDDGAPGGASPFPRHVAAVPFLGTPSRAAGGPVAPCRTVHRHAFKRRTRSSCAPRAPIPGLSWRSARLSPGPPGDVRLMVHAGRVHPSRKDPHPSDAGLPPSRLLSSSRASQGGMAPEGSAAIETSPATRYRAPCFG